VVLTAWSPCKQGFARRKEWKFPTVDQSLLREYIGHRFSALPDEYNWKLYWGKPVPLAWGPPAVLRILHFHGPKCVESVLIVTEMNRIRMVLFDKINRIPGPYFHGPECVGNLGASSPFSRVPMLNWLRVIVAQ
jgi:hypothetical protein